MGNIHSFCDVGLKISGIFPIQSRPLQVFPMTDVTAVSFADLQDSTGAGALIVGTSKGKLFVLLLSSTGDLRLLTNYQLSETSEVSKVQLAPDNDIIILQKKSISKVRASNCGAHKTCSACISASDPFCGWCPFQSKCSHATDCHAHQVNHLILYFYPL